MNNIYDDYTLEDLRFRDPVEVDLGNENVGKVIVERGDEEIAKKINELATEAWKRNSKNNAGWEYFADIAEACNVDFYAVMDDYEEGEDKEPEQIDIDDLGAFGSDDLIDEYKE